MRFTECDFDLDLRIHYYNSNYNTYVKVINDYLIVLWAGEGVCSTPNIRLGSISMYTDFEVKLFKLKASSNDFFTYRNKKYYSVSPESLGCFWSSNHLFDSNLGLYQPISLIKRVIRSCEGNGSASNISVQQPCECPCRICSRMNDVGVLECWWCGCTDPV
jgi:hypothetical protein